MPDHQSASTNPYERPTGYARIRGHRPRQEGIPATPPPIPSKSSVIHPVETAAVPAAEHHVESPTEPMHQSSLGSGDTSSEVASPSFGDTTSTTAELNTIEHDREQTPMASSFRPSPREEGQRPHRPHHPSPPPTITSAQSSSPLTSYLLRFWLPLCCCTLIALSLHRYSTSLLHPKEEYPMAPFLQRAPYKYRGSFARDFNDLNDLQLTAAQRTGITPAATRAEITDHRSLQPITCSSVVSIDPLTHSQAYLTTGAHDLLEEIGVRFMERLRRDQLPLYRPILTSATRTREDIQELQQRNGNASANSTHMYGTTFDLSWKRFEKADPHDPRVIEAAELKHLLAIVLSDLHSEGRCYIKHEARQACFHITSRH